MVDIEESTQFKSRELYKKENYIDLKDGYVKLNLHFKKQNVIHNIKCKLYVTWYNIEKDFLSLKLYWLVNGPFHGEWFQP
jgi:hypothetical protein